jgi:hypothetical protein
LAKRQVQGAGDIGIRQYKAVVPIFSILIPEQYSILLQIAVLHIFPYSSLAEASYTGSVFINDYYTLPTWLDVSASQLPPW